MVWVITSSINTLNHIYGDNIILGPRTVQCLYRSELGGITRRVANILQLCDKYTLDNMKINARYDGNKALQKAERFECEARTSIAYFDIVTSLYNLVKDPRINIKFAHMLGH